MAFKEDEVHRRWYPLRRKLTILALFLFIYILLISILLYASHTDMGTVGVLIIILTVIIMIALVPITIFFIDVFFYEHQ